jgi:hypothetical protein
MTKLCKIATAAAALAVLAAGTASAGLNPNATAQLYWQTGTGLGSTNRDNTGASPKMLVTVKGVNNVRGADVQILYNALDNSGIIPDAWAFWGGGCNDGSATFTVDPNSGANYPKLLNNAAEGAVTGLAVGQNGVSYATGDCRTPHGVALLWLSIAGQNGATRAATKEYGVWAVIFNTQFNGAGTCAGDDGTLGGICLNPNYRIPCQDVQRGPVLAVLDGNNNVDFAPYAPAKTFLTWFGTAGANVCPGVTPTAKSSWGTLKKLYK